MITLLDKKRTVIDNVQNLDEATLDQVLSRVSALAPLVAQCARDMEQDRRLPKELVSALKSARIYSMLVPRRYHGVEIDALSAVRSISALAKLDGSVGWNAMIGHLGSLIPFLVSPSLCVRKSSRTERITSLPVRVNRSGRLSTFPADGGLPADGRLPAGARTPSGSRAITRRRYEASEPFFSMNYF